jgi:hypothetical protein
MLTGAGSRLWPRMEGRYVFKHAITRFPDSTKGTQAMVMRATLPITVSERLVNLVSEEFQRHLVTMHALSPSVAT